jgi:hypothetical protein
MALVRLNVPGSCSTAVRSRRASIREAISRSATSSRRSARTRRARSTIAQLLADRRPRVPRRRCVRRPVYGQHDGDDASNSSASRRSAAPRPERPIRANRKRRLRAGQIVMDLLQRGCARATSARATRSRTRSPPPPEPAVRPTPCCICSRWRAKPACRSTIDDFDHVSERTPIIADLRPGGQVRRARRRRAGGIGLIAKRMIDAVSCTRARSRHGPHARRRSGRHRRDAGPGGRSRRPTIRSRKRAAS